GLVERAARADRRGCARLQGREPGKRACAEVPRDAPGGGVVAMPGLWFEQFAEGMVIEHPIRRTVTEADNTLFCAMTMNPAALHLDAEAMKESQFGERIVNSLFTLGLMVG